MMQKIISITKFIGKNYFTIISSFLLISFLYLNINVGISGDEYFQVDQAEIVYNYYLSAGKDTTALNPPVELMKHYGQSFDNIAFGIYKLFEVDDYYALRHMLNSITGWLLILFSGLLGIIIFGRKAGIIVLILVFASPKILGHSWNNPKDIPFAMTYVFALFFILKFIKELTKPKWSTIILLVVAIASSISIRIGGLLLVPYLFLFTGVYYLFQKDFFTKPGFAIALRRVPLLLVVSVTAYFLGLILWPYALENPIKNPLESLKVMSNYTVSLRQLFEGDTMLSNTIPWYYVIKYILMTTPIVIFVGLAAFFITLPFRKEPKNNYLFYSFMVFAFVFPIAYTIYKDSNLYGGWRHLLFAYAPIVVLSAGGFEFLISRKNKYIKYISLGILILLLIHPLRHIIKNHPYEYVYYNVLAGGVKGAYGNYELDYYYHSNKIASDWLIENELKGDSVIVVSNHSRIAEYAFRNNPEVSVGYSRYYEKGSHMWDYAIFTNTHIDPHQLKNNLWPPAGTIHTEDVDGVPIAAVIKRPSFEDYEGYQALKENRLDEAEKHFKNYLEINPNSEEIYGELAKIELRRRNYKKVIEYADKSLELYPRYLSACYSKGVASNLLKDHKTAIEYLDKAIDIKMDFPEAHYHKGYALYMQNKANDALKELQIAVNFKKDYYDAFMLMGDIMMNYRQYKNAEEKIFNHILTFKENDVKTKVKIAYCAFFQNNLPKAKEILTDVRKVVRNDFDAIKLATRIDIVEGQLDRANRYLQMMRNINNNSDLYVVRALYELKVKNIQSAKTNLDEAVKLFSNNREAKQLIASLNQPPKETKTPQSIMFKKEKPKNKVNLLNPGR